MIIIAISHVMGFPSHRRMERIISAPSAQTGVVERQSPQAGDNASCPTLRTEIDIDYDWSEGGGRWKEKGSAGAEGVRSRLRADLGEMRLIGATSPTNKTGSIAFHSPESAPWESALTCR